MIVVGREVLVAFATRYRESRPAIAVWACDVATAEWGSIADVRHVYPNSREIPGRLVVFQFKNPQFSITTQIAYTSRVVTVLGAST